MLNSFLEQTYFNNRILDYLIFLAIFVGGIVILLLFKIIILHRLKQWAKTTTTTLDNFLIRIFDRNLIPLLYYGVFYSSTKYLTLSGPVSKALDAIGVILITVFSIRFLLSIIDYALKNFWFNRFHEESETKSFQGIVTVLKVVIWGIGLTFLLDNLGFKISTVIAGLGIGGVAIALAAQTILGDLFNYFAIFFDRPFVVGDFIIVGDFLGAVEHIGIKTTRIRSLGGEQLVFSNSDLTSSRIRNYKRMEKRRVVFRLGVTYQTSLEQIKEIPGIITNIIKSVNDTVFDRAHFFSYGDFSLVFEVVYYVLSGDYNKYMDIQQEINFAIKNEFEKRGIEFAYPTQTVYLSGSSQPKLT
jgi:small-conductance mechanosensitive channel